jgi:hypothetical protein
MAKAPLPTLTLRVTATQCPQSSDHGFSIGIYSVLIATGTHISLRKADKSGPYNGHPPNYLQIAYNRAPPLR